MSEVTLAEAKGGRARIQAQLAGIQARRPAAGAGVDARAAWLRDKANVHDQIGSYLRRIGDIAGAVEAEVLATRCRVDATDLIRDDGETTTVLGPCPGLVLPRGAARTPEERCFYDGPPAPRTEQTQPSDWGDDVTCGPGLP